MSDLLTNSRLKDARACAMLHHIRYELGIRSRREEAAPKFGHLFHGGLEAWWRAWAESPENRLELALAAVAVEADAFERVTGEELLRGYHYRWIDEPYDVIAVEQEFVGPLRNPETGRMSTTWRLAGKLDVLVRDRRDGLAKLVEHKTSGVDVTPGSEYWKRLRMDGQVSVYYEGASFLGYDVAACVYDVVFKPTIRPGVVPLTDEDGVKIVLDGAGDRVRTKNGKKWRETADAELGYVLQVRDETPEEYRVRLVEAIAENPARYYQRGDVVRLEEEMRDAMADVWQTAQIIRENARANRHARNPDACVRYGRTCEFFPVCTGEASLDDPSLYVQLPSVHPELEAGNAERG